MSWEPMVVRTIDLGYEQLLMFESRPGAKLRVLYGSLWLTEEGIPQDAIVANGDEVALRARGSALLESLSPSRVEIVERVRRVPLVLRRGADSVARFARGLRQLRTRMQLARPQLG
jgi:hypothetical protein